jgi:acetate kinase
MPGTALLVLNSGSSSLKFAVFAADRSGVQPLASGAAEGIGTDEGRFWVRDGDGRAQSDEKRAIPEQAAAIRMVAETLARITFPPLAGIGHRVVHGGPALREHQRITPQVLTQLEAAVQFAPLHVPTALALIREAQRHFAGVPQFACFDTAFHRTMPEAAARFALPEKFWEAGVRRYGFHGLSCESIVYALGGEVPQRLIVAHLGNGASITAISNGLSVDTTMGLTPTGGIVMGTRPGDLDPGVLLYLWRVSGGGSEEMEKIVDRESGLLGISGISADMRQLHEAADEPRARMAVEMFCRAARKAIGAFMAILGGLDLLVFTGGIGEHDAAVRGQICDGLGALGIELDARMNAGNQRTISAPDARVRVQVLPSEEEAQIARHTRRLLGEMG